MRFEGGVEASEGVVAMGVEFSLFVDVILLVFLADGIDTEENVDHAHVSSSFSTPAAGKFGEGGILFLLSPPRIVSVSEQKRSANRTFRGESGGSYYSSRKRGERSSGFYLKLRYF